ncbi:MAG: GNAT family N-acetyltransferase [Bacteroidota bacterium]
MSADAPSWTVCPLAASGRAPAPADRHRWDALWASSGHRSPFATLAYAEAVQAALGWRYTVLGVEPARGAPLAAGLVAFHRQRGPLVRLGVPPVTPYTPILLCDDLDEASIHRRRHPLETLLRALPAGHADCTLHLAPGLDDARPLQWQGWTAQPLYTARVPFRDATDPLTQWSASARRVARKNAPRYVVAPGAPAETVALLQASYQRQARGVPAPPGQLRALATQLTATGHAQTWTARPTPASAPEAAVTLLRDDRAAYYWLAGSHPGPAMTVLMGALLPRLQADGLHYFDFVGANTPSIAEFKRRLGGERVAYLRAERTQHPWLAAWKAWRTWKRG